MRILHGHTRARTDEPSTRIFHRIRWRLTFWYSGVLAAALLLFGVSLYLSMKHTLLSPVDDELRGQMQQLSTPSAFFAPATFPPSACQSAGVPGPPGEKTQRIYLFACYDARGQLIGDAGYADAPHFTNPTLAQSALTGGAKTDTINGGGDLGRIRRYAVPAVDPLGNVVGVVQIGRSIDDRMHALDVLLLLLILLGALALMMAFGGGLFLANRALLPARLSYARQRDFIADASHELRTPLTMLRADAEVLLRDRENLSPDNAALVQDMVAETSLMSSLANTMLDLARLDTSGTHLEREVVDLSHIARDIARRMSPLAATGEVSIQAEGDDEILVVGDHLLLEQAALVLVDNAVKYNRPGGTVVIRTTAHESHARLEVQDTGIGIAPEHLPHMGERFYRVDKARSREMGGAGLGLSIVQTIASRHRGAFHMTSEPERGTVATLTLPLARGPGTANVP